MRRIAQIVAVVLLALLLGGLVVNHVSTSRASIVLSSDNEFQGEFVGAYVSFNPIFGESFVIDWAGRCYADNYLGEPAKCPDDFVVSANSQEDHTITVWYNPYRYSLGS